MQTFLCPRCATRAAFDAQCCRGCGAALGYVPERRTVVDLRPTHQPGTVTAGDDPTERWRCLNAAWGCSWVLPVAAGTEWCESCRLTHGRPDVADPVATAAWATTEAAKRRVLHQLGTLGLPVEGRSDDRPEGLVFELVHVPGEPAVTGHLTGVVTIDLTEADDVRREELRHRFGECARTLLGHLRHEMGHYYWPHLVGQTDRLGEFRALFGDERIDYARAIEDHHAPGHGGWDPDEHISAYAAAHPAEDWAESFAHHLLISDASETASATGLAPPPAPGHAPDHVEVVRRWRATADALTDVAAALGLPPPYPFDLTPRVVDKLAFVDRCVADRRLQGVVA